MIYDIIINHYYHLHHHHHISSSLSSVRISISQIIKHSFTTYPYLPQKNSIRILKYATYCCCKVVRYLAIASNPNLFSSTGFKCEHWSNPNLLLYDPYPDAPTPPNGNYDDADWNTESLIHTPPEDVSLSSLFLN